MVHVKGTYKFVVAAGETKILTSSDGISWTESTYSFTNGVTSCVWSPELSIFVITDNSSLIYYSSNGGLTSSDWTSVSTGASNVGICWSPELSIFAFANNGINIITSAYGLPTYTPNAGDVITQKSFSGVDSASNASVTGLLFNTGNTRGFKIIMTVIVDATADKFALFDIQGVYNGSTWYITSNYIGDDTSVTFSITSGGQIQYTSSTYAGFVSLTMKFKADTITI